MTYLWLVKGSSTWVLLPAAASLALFAVLLTLHAAAAGRTYAAYGCVYVATALGWLWAIEGTRPTVWDLAGAGTALTGMAVIVLHPERSEATIPGAHGRPDGQHDSARELATPSPRAG